jgi:DNA-binding MarR family transcriptional regulator
VADRWPVERVIRVAEFRAGLRVFLRHSERACRRCGLTPQRYLLLLMVKGASDGSQRANVSELADRLQLERNTVTELCARAETQGLLRRERSQDDHRVVYFTLTAEGERRLLAALEETDDLRRDFARAFRGLGEAFELAWRRPRSRAD